MGSRETSQPPAAMPNGASCPQRSLSLLLAPRRYGFGGNKRICLYDTLIDQASQDQVVAVLAHELGHW